MASLGRAVLLASLLPFSLVAAQTIVKDGKTIPADETTVAPAAEAVNGTEPRNIQLTDAVLANLTSLQLTDISLFSFDDDSAASEKRAAAPRCKVFPGDADWPSAVPWAVLDLLTGGALIKTVPIGAVCYTNNEHYDAAKCQELLAHWTESATHANDPTSVMSPLYQGQTCQPQNGNSSTCTLGGFPSYAVNISNVAQIQLAINFARSLNLRLVIQNTGHDFLGKSTGAGALSIWTHNLKKIEFVKSYGKGYCGPAMKLGAGVEVGELYAAANQYGVTALGGECKGVGVTGGYIAGGGHSPLISKFGMSSDQVLSIDVVLPSGRFVTATPTQNQDLFWALRGGGGGTFGVVVGMTVKVHPKMKFSGVTWTVLSGPDTNMTDDVFWAAMETYWRKFPEYADEGSYGYSTMFSRGPDAGYMWSMLPWMIPGISQSEFEAIVAPLFAEWDALGFQVEPAFFEHDNFYDAWSNHFPVEAVANSNLHTASRLFPRANWESPALLNETLAAIRGVVEEGSALIQYNMNGAVRGNTPDSAVNPAWREVLMYGIFGSMWADGTPLAEVEAINKRVTYDWMERLRKVTPGSGGYLNEGDVMEPNFQQAFYGTNYDRLLSIKKQVDPRDLLWAPTAVGSEGWYVTDQWDWLTLETGRLCRKE